MKPGFSVPIAGVLAIAMTLLTGCATPALWGKKPHAPAREPHLVLASASGGEDVLVCYDEHRGKSEKVQRRAYWLFECGVKTNQSPSFVDPAVLGALEPVEIVAADMTNAVPGEGYIAVVDSDPRDFSLRRGEQEIGNYTLPYYEARPRATLWRICLTPFTVAADVVLGAVVFGGAGAAR